MLQEFSFTVTFSDGGTYLYRIDGGEPQHLTSGGTLTLLHGQTALFAALPVGVIYNITEQSAPGYATSGTGHRGTITEVGCEAVFTNTSMPQQIETGRLSISKEVTDLSGGQSDALEKAFSFTIFFSDGGAYWYTIDGGEPQLLASGSALSLQHGQTAMFENLPVGVQYTVTEADYTADGYTALVRDYAGQITGSDSLSLPFVNVYEPAAESGTLSVVKDVTGEMADPDKVFAFEVTFTGAGAPASPQRFTLKAGEQKVFDNIPHGVTYTVRETDSDGALPGVEVVSGFIAGGHNASVRFQNQAPDEPEPPASIRVTKRLAGEYPEADKDKAFCLTLLVDGKETPFTLKPGETMEFEVPAGACYEVREDDSEGYSQSIADGTGTALSGQTVNVAVTNTFENDRVLAEIEGEKTWDLGGYGETVLPPSITVRLVGNDRLVEERLVTPDSNGQWHYRFTAPKYDADGAEIVYTLEEAPLDTFIPAYHGYNIKNTYRPPLSLDPPLIQKVVMGENPPETQFSFLLKGEDGAPMPEGSDGSVKIVTLKGEGNAELGRFTYEKAGVYTYTISELDGGEEGWIYDASLYTLTVTVTEQDG